MNFIRRSVGVAAIGALLLSGCGPAEAPRAAVSGKVVYKGQSVPTGSVSFINGNTVVTGQIKDGQYSIPNAAIGANKVGVTTPPAPPPQQQMQMKQKVEGKTFSAEEAKVVPVPAKYGNPETSGLTYTVTAEKTQTFDIDLKD